MQTKIGKPCRRPVLLVLALLANVMQVLGCTLPSLVICHKANQPPRLEFYSDSCSCSQEETHSACDRIGHGVPCLGEACTDIHLKSHVLLTARAPWQRDSIKGPRRTPGLELRVFAPAFFDLRPLPDDRRLSKAESPPSLSPAYANSRLRC